MRGKGKSNRRQQGLYLRAKIKAEKAKATSEALMRVINIANSCLIMATQIASQQNSKDNFSSGGIVVPKMDKNTLADGKEIVFDIDKAINKIYLQSTEKLSYETGIPVNYIRGK